MSEPSRASSRRALAAGAVAALAVAGAGYLVGRQSAPTPEPPLRPVAAPVAAPTSRPALPRPVPPLGRADLLAAARAAADALAAGRPVPGEIGELIGRRFELRLSFGCGGPAADDTASGWQYNPDQQTLRVRAAPARLDPGAWLNAPAGEAELVEAFWIDRPWTSSEACPPVEPVQPTTSPERTLAIAQFHGRDQPRSVRRQDESFEAVERVVPGQLNLAAGLRLRLSGRVVAAPGSAGPALCRSPGPAARPVCLLAVSLDSVAIENPADGAELATWDVSSPRASE